MTDVTPLLGAGAQVIETYTNRGFRVSGVEYLGAIVIVNDKVMPLEVKTLNEISVQSLSMLGGEEVSYLIVGAAKARLLDATVMQGLKKSGITAEIMEIGAACRTYNVLRTEGRQMAVALIPGGPTEDVKK